MRFRYTWALQELKPQSTQSFTEFLRAGRFNANQKRPQAQQGGSKNRSKLKKSKLNSI